VNLAAIGTLLRQTQRPDQGKPGTINNIEAFLPTIGATVAPEVRCDVSRHRRRCLKTS